MRKIFFYCENCIEAIRSHGEHPFVGDTIYADDDDTLICEWCGEDTDELKEVEF